MVVAHTSSHDHAYARMNGFGTASMTHCRSKGRSGTDANKSSPAKILEAAAVRGDAYPEHSCAACGQNESKSDSDDGSERKNFEHLAASGEDLRCLLANCDAYIATGSMTPAAG